MVTGKSYQRENDDLTPMPLGDLANCHDLNEDAVMVMTTLQCSHARHRKAGVYELEPSLGQSPVDRRRSRYHWASSTPTISCSYPITGVDRQ
jgi:hypothetical protein